MLILLHFVFTGTRLPGLLPVIIILVSSLFKTCNSSKFLFFQCIFLIYLNMRVYLRARVPALIRISFI
jgi:hypothetical protein